MLMIHLCTFNIQLDIIKSSVTVSSIHSMNWYTKIKDIPGLNMTFVDDLRTEETTLLDLLTHRTGLATADFLLVAGYPDDIATRKKLSE